MKKIVYVDMDNTLVHFQSGIDNLTPELRAQYDGNFDEAPHIFSLMEPMEHAIESYKILTEHFDTYILSTSPWENPTALNDKLDWVKRHLGQHAYKKVIFSHNKHLNKGDYLIDDRTKNGADRFEGELILFGSEKFPNWHSVIEYLVVS
jgi:5'-nucleotidase